MTTRTRKLRPHPSNRGLTLVEVIAVLVVIGVAVALAIGAAQPRTQKEAHIAKCANNLRLLAAANHCYADDFEEKFFYDWKRSTDLNGETPKGKSKRWWDTERVGRYLTTGYELRYHTPGLFDFRKYHETGEAVISTRAAADAGLGGGALQCPADRGGDAIPENLRLGLEPISVGIRSYHQNYWASGITMIPEEDIPNPGAIVAKRKIILELGQFFDRTTPADMDRLLLFADGPSNTAVASAKETKIYWATAGWFGLSMKPLQRFAIGPVNANDGSNPFRVDRWRDPQNSMMVDYLRHADNRSMPQRSGVNIAYADGHVAWRLYTELYDQERRASTFNTLWSPSDERITAEKEN